MPRSGPRTVRKYSNEFKLTAVRMSQQPGIRVKTVAAALEIHPFMLSSCGRMRAMADCEDVHERRRHQVWRASSRSFRRSSGSTPHCNRSTTS